jgi:hypothetical protein
MMNQQPDNFFRGKLHAYKKPAPQGAWEKIESALEKKTERKFVWWKVAAVFFLVAAAGSLFFLSKFNSDEPDLVEAQTELPNASEPIPTPETHESVGQTKPEISEKNEIAATVESSRSKAVVSEKPKQFEPRRVERKHVMQTPTQEETVTTGNNHLAQELAAENDSPTVESAVVLEKRSTITLTFSSEETSRYLDKNTLAEATSSEKKPSSLKKFIQKANDLKSNQDPFGDLRERKNEILALSFKNDKRGQNK